MIAYTDWQSYTWKNELKLHAERVLIALSEVIDPNFEGDHNPHHMLERALALSAFCIRRMHEKHVVTDAFRAEKIAVRSFSAVKEGFRQPFRRSGGGRAFSNYDLTMPVMVQLGRNDVANQIIHSSQLMVCFDEESIEDGILVASDWDMKIRLLHLSASEWTAFYTAVLDNYVRAESDFWDHQTGKVTSTRD
jgi:hypothetical protein